tara:strand:+ start:408 stop:584 length:177 start_codon:yes stop_codon:yes gene_type:complete
VGIEPTSAPRLDFKSVDYFTSTTLLTDTGTLVELVYELYLIKQGSLSSVDFIMLYTSS